ncbi:hypothetical protein F4677DRAFT_224576 [Hypoxylon crocopeplum]|nr:hypothetical protein F4677DRAFT_224576 [Hypoxylon crocopeplum]
MNTTIGIASRLDDWADDPSQWAVPTMLASPFGEGLQIPDSNFWGNPGHASNVYSAASPQIARDALRHDLDAADNYNSGYIVNHTNSVPKPEKPAPREYDDIAYGRTFQAGDGLFDDSLTSSTATAFSKQPSQSPGTVLSLTSTTSPADGWVVGDWSPDETVDNGESQQQSPHAETNSSDIIRTGRPAKGRRNRERNRVAAHKCRQKAKQSMGELQVRERELNQQNRMLREHAGSLRDEVLVLKNEILRHSSCDSDVIQSYIARAARGVH